MADPSAEHYYVQRILVAGRFTYICACGEEFKDVEEDVAHEKFADHLGHMTFMESVPTEDDDGSAG